MPEFIDQIAYELEEGIRKYNNLRWITPGPRPLSKKHHNNQQLAVLDSLNQLMSPKSEREFSKDEMVVKLRDHARAYEHATPQLE